jgi:hypothetical protein
MTRTISLTAVLAVAALVLAVPALSSPDTDELISIGLSQGVEPRFAPDAVDRAVAAHQLGQTSTPRYSDSASAAIEHATLTREQSQREVALRSDSADGALSVGMTPDVTTPVTPILTTSTGTEIEWPQIGFGLGLGLLLALGFWVAMRFVRIRPLAH